MNGLSAPHVFVSYSRHDESWMKRLAADLQAFGVKVWIDKTGILPGTPDWEETLRAAISTAQAVVLLASPKSRISRFVKDELSIAEMYKLPIYPLWVDGIVWIDCIPLGYGTRQYIDARDSRYQSALNELVVALGSLSAPSHLAEPYSQPFVSDADRKEVSRANPQHPTAKIDVSHIVAKNKVGQQQSVPIIQSSTEPSWGYLVFADNKPLSLSAEQLLVGRSDPGIDGLQPDIDLNEMAEAGTVSRMHAIIEHRSSASYFLTDLNSTNLTRINGKQLQPDKATPFNEGDTLSFGKVLCTFFKSS